MSRNTAQPAPAIPDRMHAAFIRTIGGPEVIEYGELPVPAPGPTDVLVRVAVTAVDPVDTFVRSGRYATPTPFPFVIGRDLVGEVVAAGPGAFAPHASQAFRPGDVVWTNSLGHGGRQGAAAEFAVIPADRCFHLPGDTDPTAAVASVHGWSTAHIGIFREAGVRPSDTVVVCGAAGAVGSGAVEFAVRTGARVVATASRADADEVLSRGADVVLDHHAPGLFDRIRAATAASGGIDVFWDTSGRQPLAEAIPLLARGARVVVTAGLHADATLPLGTMYSRDASLRGFVISNASAADVAAAAAGANRLFEAGAPTPAVADVLPLSQARQAHELLEAGHVKGRLVLSVAGEEVAR